MRSMLIKSILINGNDIEICNEEIKKTYDKREWKAIIFTEYKNNEKTLSMREKIYVTFHDDVELKKDEEIELKSSRGVTLGSGSYFEKTHDNYYIFNKLKIRIGGTDKSEPTSLFRVFNDEELLERELKYPNTTNIINKYQEGLFRIYYKMLEYSITNFSENIEGKYSAMCSYLAVRDVLKDYGLILSYPNCFIKGYKQEYDALILKKNDYKYFYSQDEILATLELKVSGCFYKKSEMEEEFSDYLMQQHGIKIIKNNNKKIYDDKNKLDIPHIYITCHESSTNTSRDGKPIRYYDTCKKVINNLGDEYIGIFCALKNNNEQFIIPIDFNLAEILKKVSDRNA